MSDEQTPAPGRRSAGRRAAARPARGSRGPRGARGTRSAPAPKPSRPARLPREGDRRTPFLALVLVALTAGALAVTGTAGRPTGLASTPTQQVAAGERTLICPGGLGGARQLSGSVSGSTSSTIADPPTAVQASGADAASTYAAQVARSSRWLAYGACPEPRASWWFVGLGGSTLHDSTLTLSNPRAGDALVDVDVLGENGPVDAPGLHGLAVPSGGSRTLDLAKLAPSAGDLAVHVTASRGLVAASAAEQQSADFLSKAVSEWVPGQPDAARRLTLTGLPDKPDAATLLVANPGQSEAVVKVEAIGSGGTFAPQGAGTMTVSPGSVASLKVKAAFDGKPVALRISSPQDVVATVRAVLGSDETYAGATTPLVGTSAAAVPAGLGGEVVLSSTGRAGSVTVTSYDKGGSQVGATTVAVPAGTSVREKLSGRTRYVVLRATSADAVAGLVLSSGSGVGSTAIAPVQLESRLPGVLPGS